MEFRQEENGIIKKNKDLLFYKSKMICKIY